MNLSLKNIFIYHIAEIHIENIDEILKYWQYSIILDKAIIGQDCNINRHMLIENEAVLGNSVIIKC